MRRGRQRELQDSMHDRASGVVGVGSNRGRNQRRRASSRALGPDSILEAQRRGAGGLWRILAFAGGAAAVGAGGLAAHRFATTSPRFAVESIEVRGARRASRESIVRLAGVSTGENIFAVDPEAVAKNVGGHPWVAGARVIRRYPHTLEIDLVEHQPVALVALGHLYYASERGEIVKRYTPGEHEELPIITGLTKAEVEADDEAAHERLRSAIGFMKALREILGDAAPRVAEVHLDPALGLSFVASGSDERVQVGSPPWRPHILRLAEVEGALAHRGVQASHIILGGERRPDRAVARLSAQTTAPDAPLRGGRGAGEKETHAGSNERCRSVPGQRRGAGSRADGADPASTGQDCKVE